MESKLENPNLKLAKTITEKFMETEQVKLGKEAFYMFSVSKFILLKEKIIKKDSSNNIIYFNNIKYKKYIPIILEFYNLIKSNGNYKRNNSIVELTDKSNYIADLDDAIWCFNKIRDSLAHGKYKFDYVNKSLVIDNVASDNSYLLKCNIPINLLNSFTFISENKEELIDKEELRKRYREYIKSMSNNFEFDDDIYNNQYIYKYKNYNDYILKNNIISNTYNIDNKIYNTYNYSNINYDLPKLDQHDYYTFLDKKTFEKDLLFDTELYSILSYEIDKLSIDELCKLAKQLLLIRPSTETEKKYIISLLKEFKSLLQKYNSVKEKEKFNADTEKLIREMKSILGIRSETSNTYGIISLYNYMSLLFSQTDDINYSKLKLDSMIIDFDPQNKKDGTGVNYNNVLESIQKKCLEFNQIIDLQVKNYNEHQNQNFRHSLMDIFAKFYSEIMESLGIKNKYVVDSVRNSIEHGNYNYHKKGYIIMYDQNNHNDVNSVKFISAVTPNKLFDISRQIENQNNQFLLKDFMQQLSSVVGNELFEKTWFSMNQLSNIIFGEELNLDYTMENMYHEALARIISSHVSK